MAAPSSSVSASAPRTRTSRGPPNRPIALQAKSRGPMSATADTRAADNPLLRRFRFAEHGTTLGRDTVAGVTTFVVMSYIIFVNPAILGFVGNEALADQGLP